MPRLRISIDCYAQTFTSIAQHFENKTLQRRLASLTLPTVVLLGADSPIPPKHGVATAALIRRQLPDRTPVRALPLARTPRIGPHGAGHHLPPTAIGPQ